VTLGITQTVRTVPLPDNLPKTERADEVAIAVDIKATAVAAAQVGMAALGGEQGATYDSLLLTASLILHHLGKEKSFQAAGARVRAVLDSGCAVERVK
jgi:anthranilate phosphoribosyltransferase